MTVLRGITPTPEQLGEAWKQAFEPTLRDAGGADGRISKASAARIAERDDAGRLAADNAVAFFERTGQKTVSVAKLLRVLGEDATTEGAAVAGRNRKVSLREGERLPARLQADFFYLRGKGLPDVRTHNDFITDATTQVRAAFEAGDLRRLEAVPWQARNRRPITQFYDEARRANFYIFEGQGQLFLSIGASAGSPLRDQVGWYHVGDAPAPAGAPR